MILLGNIHRFVQLQALHVRVREPYTRGTGATHPLFSQAKGIIYTFRYTTSTDNKTVYAAMYI